MSRIRIGLALGSGVARGWAHLGVLRAINRLGLVPDIIAGSSVGALVGGFYLAGHIDPLEQWVRDLTKLRMLRYLNLPLSGEMISGDRLFQEAERYLGDMEFSALPTPFVAVATDLWTGHEIWLREGRLIDALRASLSLPGLFKPLRLNGHWLIDGALVNPVPVSVCRALGAQMVISVNLNADIMGKELEFDTSFPTNNGETAKAKGTELTPGVLSVAEILEKNGKRKRADPSMFTVMAASLNIVQERITRGRLAGEPPDVSINPRIGHVGLLDFHRADELISLGEDAVERAMPEIMDAVAVFSALHE